MKNQFIGCEIRNHLEVIIEMSNEEGIDPFEIVWRWFEIYRLAQQLRELSNARLTIDTITAPMTFYTLHAENRMEVRKELSRFTLEKAISPEGLRNAKQALEAWNTKLRISNH